MFSYDFSDELKEIIKKLNKKDRKRALIIANKIQEIINNNNETIDRYQNLRYDLKEYKHVHIDKSFVLVFKVFKDKSFILFDKFDHHDKIYKR